MPFLSLNYRPLLNLQPFLFHNSNPRGAMLSYSRFVSANLAANKFKNRLVNILPFESSRVCLQPLRGLEGSDYINASFIDGYRCRAPPLTKEI